MLYSLYTLRKTWIGFITFQLLLWGSTIVFGAKDNSNKLTPQQQYIISKHKLTNCVHYSEKKQEHPSLNQLGQTWIEKKIVRSLRNKNAIICTLPVQKQKYWTTAKSYYFEKRNIVALGKDDPLSLNHEGIHTLQHTPNAYLDNKKITAAYQTLLAHEIGALCFSILDAHQKSAETTSALWKDDTDKTYSEYVGLIILESIINDNLDYESLVKDKEQRPPANIVDEFLYQLLQEGLVFHNYETTFYAHERGSFLSTNDIDFTPLTPNELNSAIHGSLYKKEELPKTIGFLSDLGKQASTRDWFTSRMEPNYQQRAHTAIIPVTQP